MAGFPVREGTVVNCIPSFVPESADGGAIPSVSPYLEHSGKLYPIEVPANTDFEGLVAATSMECPAMLRMDTHFPIPTDDKIVCASAQEVHLEQMRLAELRKEDELRAQQAAQLRKARVMNEQPPKAVSRDALPPATAFNNPEPQSTSQWGDKTKVSLIDERGSHGVEGVDGWVTLMREGTNWDEAATEAFGVPMQITDIRTQVVADTLMMTKCTPNHGQPEAVKSGGFDRLPTGAWFPVPIQVQLNNQRITLTVRSTEPADSVEARAQVQSGIGVRFCGPRPTSWKRYYAQCNVPLIPASRRRSEKNSRQMDRDTHRH
jgi:hypothetical protein